VAIRLINHTCQYNKIQGRCDFLDNNAHSTALSTFGCKPTNFYLSQYKIMAF
jgi:hypothetical protein